MVQQGGAEWWQGYELNDGRYIIREILGRGGFGIVFRAEDTKDNKQVAIKFLRGREELERIWIALGNNQTLSFDKLEEDFVKEAMYLKECQHSFIAKYQDIIKTSFGWCIVMEYIDGQDLDSWVSDRGALLEQEALSYIQQIGQAVAAIHKKGLLHRDIKPKNIMRKADGSKAILIDMGIARQFSPNEWITQTVQWTQGYAPPEQYSETVKKEEYSDVYALAATLYFLLTTEPPQASIERQQEDNLIDKLIAMEKERRISHQVRVAIETGMKLNRHQRSQSIEEWFELLPSTKTEEEGKPKTDNTNLLLRGGMIGIIYGSFTSPLFTSYSSPEPYRIWLIFLLWLLVLGGLNLIEYRNNILNLINKYKYFFYILMSGVFLVLIIHPNLSNAGNLLLILLLPLISSVVSLLLMYICIYFFSNKTANI
ncbi:serine/threonine protein kinase [Calothrix brevissima NIES-22]|nr:serine/threonine protein kinase [Calothrix brevissima NIES-22]